MWGSKIKKCWVSISSNLILIQLNMIKQWNKADIWSTEWHRKESKHQTTEIHFKDPKVLRVNAYTFKKVCCSQTWVEFYNTYLKARRGGSWWVGHSLQDVTTSCLKAGLFCFTSETGHHVWLGTSRLLMKCKSVQHGDMEVQWQVTMKNLIWY